MAFTFVPNDANTLSVQHGVDHLLSGYIIQDESITENVDQLQVPDQKNRIAQVISYQRWYNCSLTVMGPVTTQPAVPGSTLSWYTTTGTKIDYVVDNVTLNCVYNDTAKWNMSMTAYINASYADKTDAAI